MPAINIVVGQTEALYVYRLTFPDGKLITVAVAPLNADVAGRVIGTLSEEYTLLVPIEPRGYPWAFLRGYASPVQYIQERTALPPWACSLLGAMIIPLVAAAPADDILRAATAWYEGS
jgi:hypothetical protein